MKIFMNFKCVLTFIRVLMRRDKAKCVYNVLNKYLYKKYTTVLLYGPGIVLAQYSVISIYRILIYKEENDNFAVHHNHARRRETFKLKCILNISKVNVKKYRSF